MDNDVNPPERSDPPVEEVIEIALHDQEPELRLMALHFASIRLPEDQAAELLQQATKDHDPLVGMLAKEMLQSAEAEAK